MLNIRADSNATTGAKSQVGTAKKLDSLMLAADIILPHRNFDHPLTGEWIDHRDCHIRPDLVLIYRKPDDASLELVRLSSHSELGL